MKSLTLFIVTALFIASPALAQEKAVLATPVAAPSVTEYSIRYFAIDVENSRILIELKSNTGELKQVTYSDSAPVTVPVTVTNPDGTTTTTDTVTPSDKKATNMIIALNKANLSVKSLQRRIFEALIADGHLSGSVTGTPR